jgi:hypothetical protein
METFIQLSEKPSVLYEVKVFIKDDGVPTFSTSTLAPTRDAEWVDFTDKCGTNLIQSVGQITHNMEGKAGFSSFTASVSNINADNSSGFWDKPIELHASFTGINATPESEPPCYGNSVPTSLTTTLGNIAYFTLSYNSSRTVFERRILKISLNIVNDDGSISTNDVGVFIIKNISRNLKTRLVEISLESISMNLVRADASSCKDGYDWYRNKDASFLTNKLIEKAYNGVIPSTFIIDKNIQLETAASLREETGDNRTLSYYGKPPLFDGTQYNNKIDPCEALLVWQYGTTGTTAASDKKLKSVDSSGTANDYAEYVQFITTLASVEGNGTFPTSPSLMPIIGDTIRIKTGVNAGIYTILSFDSITASKPIARITPRLKGLNDSNMEYAITRVYMGIGPELWVWDPEKNTYYSLWTYDVDQPEICPLGYKQLIMEDASTSNYKFKIRRLWNNSSSGRIIGAAWTEHIDTETLTTLDGAKLRSPYVYFKEFIIKFDINATTTHYHSWSVRSTPIGQVFTGEYSLRAPSNFANGFLVGLRQTIDPSGEGGENLCIPFQQKIEVIPLNRYNDDYSYTYRGSRDDPLSIESQYAGTSSGYEFQEGFHTISLDTEYKAIRFSMGQRGFVIYNENCNDTGATSYGGIFFATIDITSNNVDLTKVNIEYLPINGDVASGAKVTVTNGDDLKISTIAVQPLCGSPDINYGSKSSYVALICWNNTSNNISSSHICKITNTSGDIYSINVTPIVTFGGGSNNYVTPLDMISRGTNHFMLILHRDRIVNQDSYKSCKFGEYTETVSLVESPNNYKGILKGLVHSYDPDNIVTVTFREFYFHDSHMNVLMYHPIDITVAGIILDGGHPPLQEAPFLSSNLTVDEFSHDNKSTPGRTVYGISALKQMPIETQYIVDTRDFYYLWKYDTFFIPIVKYADFSDLNIWEALGLLAEITDHVIGYYLEDFFFIGKEYFGDAQLTFENSTEHDRLIDINVSQGIEEIYNHASIIPQTPTFTQPTGSLGLVTRYYVDSNNGVIEEKAPDVNLVVSQSDKIPKKIRLSCIEGGTITSAKPKFKFLIYSNSYESILSEIFLTGSFIYVDDGVSDIKAGDMIFIYGVESETNDKGFDIFTTFTKSSYVKSDPTDDDKEAGKITLTDAFDVLTDPTFGYPVGTKVVIIQKPNNRWSDEISIISLNPFFQEFTGTTTSPTLNNWTTNGTGSLTLVDLFMYGSYSARLYNPADVNYYIYQTVTLEAVTTYSITGWVKGGSKTYGVKIIINSSYTETGALFSQIIYNDQWTKVSGVFTTVGGGSFKIYIGSTSLSSSVYIDSIILNEGSYATPPYIPVYAHNHSYPVGDSGVYVRFDWTTSETERAATGYVEGEFKTGDFIDIECKGEALTPSKDIQVALNSSSIKTYGKLEFPALQNRFVDYRTGKHIVQRIVNSYAYPHYNISVKSILLPVLSFIASNNKLGIYSVRDTTLFPLEKDNTIRGYLKSFNYDLSSKMMSLEIRSENVY